MDFYQSNYSTYKPVMPDMGTMMPEMDAMIPYMGTMMSADMNMMNSFYPDAHFVKVLNNCTNVCFSTMSKLAGRPDSEKQIKLLHDCARMCQSQVIYTVVGSIFAKQHAAFCALVCETCGLECSKHPDELSQYCSRVCLHCAEMCKRYASL